MATAIGRLQWAASHLTIALFGSAAVLAVLGLTTGLTYGWSTGAIGDELPRVFASTMMALPAVWVMVGMTMALYGWHHDSRHQGAGQRASCSWHSSWAGSCS